MTSRAEAIEKALRREREGHPCVCAIKNAGLFGVCRREPHPGCTACRIDAIFALPPDPPSQPGGAEEMREAVRLAGEVLYNQNGKLAIEAARKLDAAMDNLPTPATARPSLTEAQRAFYEASWSVARQEWSGECHKERPYDATIDAFSRNELRGRMKTAFLAAESGAEA